AFVFASAVITRLYGRGAVAGGVKPGKPPRPPVVSVAGDPWPGFVGGPPRPAFDAGCCVGDGEGEGLLVEQAAVARPAANVATEIAARFIISWM
ncbi:MAG TPA: hypothetical protein VI259_28310, partial [Gemmatimonadaceae bacterium]